MAETPQTYPDEAAIVAIGVGFADLTLPKAQWTHSGHFAACLWLMRCRPDLVAERDMPDMIRRYNIATGGVNSATAGYHETITQASIRAARSALRDAPDAMPLHGVHALLMNGPCGRKDWLLEYWSSALLMSSAARMAWVSPDIMPLPC